jgi:hypothetical protein
MAIGREIVRLTAIDLETEKAIEKETETPMATD